MPWSISDYPKETAYHLVKLVRGIQEIKGRFCNTLFTRDVSFLSKWKNLTILWVGTSLKQTNKQKIRTTSSTSSLFLNYLFCTSKDSSKWISLSYNYINYMMNLHHTFIHYMITSCMITSYNHTWWNYNEITFHTITYKYINTCCVRIKLLCITQNQITMESWTPLFFFFSIKFQKFST